MECLRRSGYESAACRQSAMAYLECRMDRRVGPAAPARLRGERGALGGALRGWEPAVTQGILSLKETDAPCGICRLPAVWF